MTSKEDNDYFINYNMQNQFNNLLRLEGMPMDTSVYRVYSLKYFIELFENKENTLVKPAAWDDPWENFLLKQTINGHSSGIPVSLEGLLPKYYGQCWTFNDNETDALWRIYSPNKDGIRIKTTLQKLWDSFFKLTDPTAMVSYFIAGVNYFSEDEIRKYFQDEFKGRDILDSTGKVFAYFLSLKRMEFAHEKELRLIYSTDNHMNPLYKYTVDPNSLIEEVLFDPRMGYAYFKLIESALKTKYGFNGVIKKSRLYQVPNLNINWE